jgi:DNA-binding SARP family transcriptional activator/pimeloyl-ACP methyl ester carboxylesterase
VRLLGPVEVTCDGRLVTIGGSRARTLLAVLAIRAGRVVDTSALTEAVWGDHAPRTAAHALHVHASTVRRALGSRGHWLQSRPPGYVLALEPDALDIDRFEHAARDGRAELASGRPDAAVARLSDALAFWRGSPLADVPWERFADAEVRRLEMLRLATEEDRVEATLQLGDAKSAAADAEELVAGDPLREHRWILLMRALYASGRHAEALRRAQDVRRFFADEVGLAPSPALTRLESLIARHDPGLGRPDGTAPPDDVPTTRFLQHGGTHLAYQTIGRGPPDMVFIPGFTGHLELRWEDPDLTRLYGRLARSCRLILFDKRGTGMSDRDHGMPPIEDQVDDVIAIMNATDADRVFLFGVFDGAAIALLTAAWCPDRVRGVIAWTAFPVLTADDYPHGAPSELIDAMRELVERGLIMEDAIPLWAPSRVGDTAFARRLNRLLRMGLGIGGAATLLRRLSQIDIRPALSGIHAPVLLLQRSGDRVLSPENAEWMANRLPAGSHVLLPGDDNVMWAGPVEPIADKIEAFLAANGRSLPSTQLSVCRSERRAR